ncbi:MAG: DUF1971 domain-containing protein [Hellea sp.]
MMIKLPESVIKYAETPIFTEETVPKKLLNVHDTKAGTWGRLVVLEGAVDYIIPGPPLSRQTLDVKTNGIIEPTIPHNLELTGPVRFKVEFLK